MPPARTQLAQVGTTEGHRVLLLLSRIKVLSHLLFQAALFLPGRPGSKEKGFFLLFAGSPPSLNPRCEGTGSILHVGGCYGGRNEEFITPSKSRRKKHRKGKREGKGIRKGKKKPTPKKPLRMILPELHRDIIYGPKNPTSLWM